MVSNACDAPNPKRTLGLRWTQGGAERDTPMASFLSEKLNMHTGVSADEYVGA